jgi:hypothetical protein
MRAFGSRDAAWLHMGYGRAVFRSLFFATLLCLGVFASVPAYAQGVTSTATTVRAPTPYEQALRYYERAAFEEAARAFERAYALSGRAEILFNVGRAYEEARQYELALAAYERYERAAPPGFDRAVYDQRVAAVRAAITSARPAVAPVATSAPPQVAAAPAPTARPNRTLPLALMIGGGVALGGAVTLGVVTAMSHSELEDVCTNGVCSASRRGDIDVGRTQAIVADVAGAVGIAAIATGVVVWVLQGSPTSTRTTTALSCTRGTCGPAVGFTF